MSHTGGGPCPDHAQDAGEGPEVLVELTKAINFNLDLRSVLQAVTDAGTRLSGAQIGAFFYNARDAEGQQYRYHVLSGAAADAFARIPEPRITALFAPTFAGEGLTRIADLARDSRLSGLPPAHLPVRSYLATPVMSRSGEVIGALLFGHADPDVFDEASERSVRIVAAQAAVAVENARLFEAEQVARLRAEHTAAQLAVLQSVTARLVTALTTEDVLQAVVESICEPMAAGRVGVYLREGTVFRAVGGVSRTPAPGGSSFSELPVDLASPLRDAVESREPVHFGSAEELAARYPALAVGGLVGIGAGLALPLLLPDAVSGVLALAWEEPRELADAEVEMLVAAAGQLASALERARLFEAEREVRRQLSASVAALTEVSRTLQRSLLPRALPELPQVELAVRYVPGTAGAEVGGDWYDVVLTPDGGVTFVVGDVQGHSVAAAAVMGQLRTALHAYLAEGHPAEVAVARANAVLEELDPTLIATCALVEHHPGRAFLRIVRAGHPTPLMRRADGTVHELEATGGVPLGVLEDADWPVTTVPVEDGCRLLLYTDGLVERAGRGPDAGVAALMAATATTTSGSAGDDADAILAAMGDAMTDDVALLLCDFAGARSTRRAVAMHVGGALEAVAAARDFTRTAVAQWQLPELADTATLLVSELVTNALVHTQGPATLELCCEDARLRLSVIDSRSEAPRAPAAPDLESPGGRGLLLVDALATSWGVEAHEPGKAVWAEIAAGQG